jgi:diamine N-acetyltransferase
MKVHGTTIFLRTVEISDCSYLLSIENDPKNWEYSDTSTPYTEEEIIQFIIEQKTEEDSEQIRFLICFSNSSEPIGNIDIFSIDKENKTAKVGILIQQKEHRKKGYASESVQLIKNFAKKKLGLKQLECAIQEHNLASQRLFTGQGFKLVNTDSLKKINHFICDL